MSEIISCGIKEHKNKKENDNNIKYDDNLAEFFANEVGAKPRGKETIVEQDERGAFVRQPNYFTEGISRKYANEGKFVIYWAPLCNWSNRPVIVKELLGLDDVILDYIVDHTGDSNKYGWGFPKEKGFKDKYTGVHFLSEFYLNADKFYTGRATTPTLVDINKKIAVNNDYHRLTNHIEVAFRDLQPKDAPDLYPIKYRSEIDDFNDWLFPHVNNGHYRQAFTNNPDVYEESQEDFHKALEALDKRLETNRFLFGDYILDSDIRAYVTFIKWETDFYVNVGPQKKRISEYKNIWEYVKELYNIPAFKKHTNLPKEDTARGPYLAKIAKRDFDSWLKTDGSRKLLSNDPDNLFLQHPKDETVDDYIKEVSKSKWNDKSASSRADWNYILKTNPEINPLKGLLKNE